MSTNLIHVGMMETRFETQIIKHEAWTSDSGSAYPARTLAHVRIGGDVVLTMTPEQVAQLHTTLGDALSTTRRYS